MFHTYAQLVAAAAVAPVDMPRWQRDALLSQANKTESELQADVDALAARNRRGDCDDDDDGECEFFESDGSPVMIHGGSLQRDSIEVEPEYTEAYTSLVYAMADHAISNAPLPVDDEQADAILAMAHKSYDDLGTDLNTLMDIHARERFTALKWEAAVAAARYRAEQQGIAREAAEALSSRGY